MNGRVEPPTVSATPIEKTLIEAGFKDVLDQKRFVLYSREKREGKTTKVPKRIDGSNAGSTIPESWATFHEVYQAYVSNGRKFDGIGIILGDHFGTKIVGVDMDHVCNALSGKWENAEAEIAAASLKTYGERSISGTGVHFLFKDQDVPDGFKTRTGAGAPFDLEVYEKGRYFTLSGEWFNGHQFNTDEVGLKGLCDSYLPLRETKAPRSEKKVEPRKVEPQAMSVGTGRFDALWSGSRPHGNESADDLALINMLVARVGRDPQKVMEKFISSPHFQSKDEYHRRKCEDREDYLSETIRKAIDSYYVGYSFDDVGNSDMFSDTYGEALRFCKEWNDWVFWNGRYWEKKASLHAQELAKDLSHDFRLRLKEYRERPAGQVPEILKAMTKHSQKMREAKAIRAMTALASSRLVSDADMFDRNPMILNCQNGEVDLATGKLRDHSIESYCTNIAGARYEEDAEAPKWNAFLDKVLPGEGREYLQMCVGMAAVGKVYEEAMIFMIGSGANGKSTIANILSEVFGTYALTLQPDVITATKDGKTPPDFAEVRGKRIVFLSETEEGDRLSTKALKRLSSNEMLAARRLYSMPETFMPTHTVFYSTNHAPRIGSGDYGTWRRIKHLPFEYKFTDAEKQTDFAQMVVQEEGAGIFKWVVEGAVKFIANGCKLPTPSFVVEATEEYRENEDVIGQFLKEKCLMGKNDKEHTYRVGSSDLFSAYKDYCRENQTYCKPISDFNNSLVGVDGVIRMSVGGRKLWDGIRLKTLTEERVGEVKVGTW